MSPRLFFTHVLSLLLFALFPASGQSRDEKTDNSALLGQRFLTLNTIVRVRQIEVTRDTAHGPDESAVHTPADNLHYLSEKENIHVCQGNIWSQYAVDNGDGEGSICYPYYPSREHFCKPARGKEDFIDCVNLDGWTVDFLCARIPGARTVNGERWRSRQGVGPIETLLDMGTERGLEAMMATTATHFDDGFRRNGFAWVTCGWEMSLVEARKIHGYGGKDSLGHGLPTTAIRAFDELRGLRTVRGSHVRAVPFHSDSLTDFECDTA